MTCPRCQRRTVLSHGEPWCVVCGTVTPKPSDAELAEMVASTLPRPGGQRRPRPPVLPTTAKLIHDGDPIA